MNNNKYKCYQCIFPFKLQCNLLFETSCTVLKVFCYLNYKTIQAQLQGISNSFILLKEKIKSSFSECLLMLFLKNQVPYNDCIYTGSAKNLTLPYVSREWARIIENGKTYNQWIQWMHFWLKIFGPNGARGSSVKISSGKVSLMAYHCNSLFKTIILIKKICPTIISKGDSWCPRR